MKAIRLLMVVAVLLSISQVLFAFEVRVYQLGDIDDLAYNGSLDWPYVDPDWITVIHDEGPGPIAGFDSSYHNVNRPFSFAYTLAPQEQICGATLDIAIRSANVAVTTDRIFLEQIENLFTYEELGWLPVSSTQTQIKTLDLSNVMGNNFLPFLQDGLLNVLVEDDTSIDYVTLTIEVVPEPSTVWLLGLGCLALKRRRC